MSTAATLSRQPIGLLGIHTQAAVDLFRASHEDRQVTLEKMNAAVKRDCTCDGDGYGNVGSAIRHIVRHDGHCWKWERELPGWVLQDAPGIQQDTAHHRKLSGKRAKWRWTKLRTIDKSKLADAERRNLEVHLCIEETLVLATSSQFDKKIKLLARPATPSLASLVSLMNDDTNGASP